MNDNDTSPAQGKRFRSKKYRTALEKRWHRHPQDDTHHLPTTPPLPDATTPSHADHVAIDERLGARRARRFRNDAILRALAGPLSASDMRSLFAPVPFGDSTPSPFSLILQPHVAPVWDLFRSINMDREQKVLFKWEAHVRAERRGGGGSGEGGGRKTRKRAPLSPAALALQSWAAVGRKGRAALLRCSVELLEELEMPLLSLLHVMEEEEGGGMRESIPPSSSSTAPLPPYVERRPIPPRHEREQGEGEEEDEEEEEEWEVVYHVADSFQRLAIHALASFHRLSSASHNDAGTNGRCVIVRRRRQLTEQEAEWSEGTSGDEWVVADKEGKGRHAAEAASSPAASPLVAATRPTAPIEPPMRILAVDLVSLLHNDPSTCIETIDAAFSRRSES